MFKSIEAHKHHLQQTGIEKLMKDIDRLDKDLQDIESDLTKTKKLDASRETAHKLRDLRADQAYIQKAIADKQRQLEEARKKYMFLTQPVVLEINRETTKQQEKVNNAFDKFIAEFDQLKLDRMKLASQAEKEYDSEIAPFINNRDSRITMDVRLDFVRNHNGYGEDAEQHNGF